MPTSQTAAEARTHVALPDIFRTINGKSFDIGPNDRMRVLADGDGGGGDGVDPDDGAKTSRCNHARAPRSYPRIVLRDALGYELDTFTTLQQSIYRAKWHIKQTGQAKTPLEWRLPKAPLPARPDFTRSFPPLKHPPTIPAVDRERLRSYRNNALEFDVDDIGFVKESLELLPFAPSLSFLRQEFLVGPKTYFQIVGTMLLHKKYLSQTEKRDALYSFPGFCTGCSRLGLCYGCEKGTEPHYHEDKPVRTGGGYTYFKKDRPEKQMKSRNPVNWKVNHPDLALKELMEEFGGVGLDGEIPEEVKKLLDEHGGHLERNIPSNQGNGTPPRSRLNIPNFAEEMAKYHRKPEDNEEDEISIDLHDDDDDDDERSHIKVNVQGHKGKGGRKDQSGQDDDSDEDLTRVDEYQLNGDASSKGQGDLDGIHGNRRQKIHKGATGRRFTVRDEFEPIDASTTISSSNATFSSRRSKGQGLLGRGHGGEWSDTTDDESRKRKDSKTRGRSSPEKTHRLPKVRKDHSEDDREDEEDEEDEEEASAQSKRTSRGRRRERLYKPPPAFKLKKSPGRKIMAKSPFSTERSYDLPKGGGFEIKKSDKSPTKFKEFRNVDATWKEPKKFELKKVEQKSTKFWSGPPKSKSSDDVGRKASKSQSRSRSPTHRKIRRVPSPRAVSPDSGLDSEFLTAVSGNRPALRRNERELSARTIPEELSTLRPSSQSPLSPGQSSGQVSNHIARISFHSNGDPRGTDNEVLSPSVPYDQFEMVGDSAEQAFKDTNKHDDCIGNYTDSVGKVSTRRNKLNSRINHRTRNSNGNHDNTSPDIGDSRINHSKLNSNRNHDNTSPDIGDYRINNSKRNSNRNHDNTSQEIGDSRINNNKRNSNRNHDNTSPDIGDSRINHSKRNSNRKHDNTSPDIGDYRINNSKRNSNRNNDNTSPDIGDSRMNHGKRNSNRNYDNTSPDIGDSRITHSKRNLNRNHDKTSPDIGDSRINHSNRNTNRDHENTSHDIGDSRNYYNKRNSNKNHDNTSPDIGDSRINHSKRNSKRNHDNTRPDIGDYCINYSKRNSHRNHVNTSPDIGDSRINHTNRNTNRDHENTSHDIGYSRNNYNKRNSNRKHDNTSPDIGDYRINNSKRNSNRNHDNTSQDIGDSRINHSKRNSNRNHDNTNPDIGDSRINHSKRNSNRDHDNTSPDIGDSRINHSKRNSKRNHKNTSPDIGDSRINHSNRNTNRDHDKTSHDIGDSRNKYSKRNRNNDNTNPDIGDSRINHSKRNSNGNLDNTSPDIGDSRIYHSNRNSYRNHDNTSPDIGISRINQSKQNSNRDHDNTSPDIGETRINHSKRNSNRNHDNTSPDIVDSWINHSKRNSNENLDNTSPDIGDSRINHSMQNSNRNHDNASQGIGDSRIYHSNRNSYRNHDNTSPDIGNSRINQSKQNSNRNHDNTSPDIGDSWINHSMKNSNRDQDNTSHGICDSRITQSKRNSNRECGNTSHNIGDSRFIHNNLNSNKDPDNTIIGDSRITRDNVNSDRDRDNTSIGDSHITQSKRNSNRDRCNKSQSIGDSDLTHSNIDSNRGHDTKSHDIDDSHFTHHNRNANGDFDNTSHDIGESRIANSSINSNKDLDNTSNDIGESRIANSSINSNKDIDNTSNDIGESRIANSSINSNKDLDNISNGIGDARIALSDLNSHENLDKKEQLNDNQDITHGIVKSTDKHNYQRPEVFGNSTNALDTNTHDGTLEKDDRRKRTQQHDNSSNLIFNREQDNSNQDMNDSYIPLIRFNSKRNKNYTNQNKNTCDSDTVPIGVSGAIMVETGMGISLPKVDIHRARNPSASFRSLSSYNQGGETGRVSVGSGSLVSEKRERKLLQSVYQLSRRKSKSSLSSHPVDPGSSVVMPVIMSDAELRSNSSMSLGGQFVNHRSWSDLSGSQLNRAFDEALDQSNGYEDSYSMQSIDKTRQFGSSYGDHAHNTSGSMHWQNDNGSGAESSLSGVWSLGSSVRVNREARLSDDDTGRGRGGRRERARQTTRVRLGSANDEGGRPSNEKRVRLNSLKFSNHGGLSSGCYKRDNLFLSPVSGSPHPRRSVDGEYYNGNGKDRAVYGRSSILSPRRHRRSRAPVVYQPMSDAVSPIHYMGDNYRDDNSGDSEIGYERLEDNAEKARRFSKHDPSQSYTDGSRSRSFSRSRRSGQHLERPGNRGVRNDHADHNDPMSKRCDERKQIQRKVNRSNIKGEMQTDYCSDGDDSEERNEKTGVRMNTSRSEPRKLYQNQSHYDDDDRLPGLHTKNRRGREGVPISESRYRNDRDALPSIHDRLHTADRFLKSDDDQYGDVYSVNYVTDVSSPKSLIQGRSKYRREKRGTAYDRGDHIENPKDLEGRRRDRIEKKRRQHTTYKKEAPTNDYEDNKSDVAPNGHFQMKVKVTHRKWENGDRYGDQKEGLENEKCADAEAEAGTNISRNTKVTDQTYQVDTGDNQGYEHGQRDGHVIYMPTEEYDTNDTEEEAHTLNKCQKASQNRIDTDHANYNIHPENVRSDRGKGKDHKQRRRGREHNYKKHSGKRSDRTQRHVEQISERGHDEDMLSTDNEVYESKYARAEHGTDLVAVRGNRHARSPSFRKANTPPNMEIFEDHEHDPTVFMNAVDYTESDLEKQKQASKHRKTGKYSTKMRRARNQNALHETTYQSDAESDFPFARDTTGDVEKGLSNLSSVSVPSQQNLLEEYRRQKQASKEMQKNKGLSNDMRVRRRKPRNKHGQYFLTNHSDSEDEIVDETRRAPKNEDASKQEITKGKISRKEKHLLKPDNTDGENGSIEDSNNKAHLKKKDRTGNNAFSHVRDRNKDTKTKVDQVSDDMAEEYKTDKPVSKLKRKASHRIKSLDSDVTPNLKDSIYTNDNNKSRDKQKRIKQHKSSKVRNDFTVEGGDKMDKIDLKTEEDGEPEATKPKTNDKGDDIKHSKKEPKDHKSRIKRPIKPNKVHGQRYFKDSEYETDIANDMQLVEGKVSKGNKTDEMTVELDSTRGYGRKKWRTIGSAQIISNVKNVDIGTTDGEDQNTMEEYAYLIRKSMKKESGNEQLDRMVEVEKQRSMSTGNMRENPLEGSENDTETDDEYELSDEFEHSDGYNDYDDASNVNMSPPIISDYIHFENKSLTSNEPDMDLVFDDIIDVANIEITEVADIDPGEEARRMKEERRRRRHKHKKRKRRDERKEADRHQQENADRENTKDDPNVFKNTKNHWEKELGGLDDDNDSVTDIRETNREMPESEEELFHNAVKRISDENRGLLHDQSVKAGLHSPHFETYRRSDTNAEYDFDHSQGTQQKQIQSKADIEDTNDEDNGLKNIEHDQKAELSNTRRVKESGKSKGSARRNKNQKSKSKDRKKGNKGVEVTNTSEPANTDGKRRRGRKQKHSDDETNFDKLPSVQSQLSKILQKDPKQFSNSIGKDVEVLRRKNTAGEIESKEEEPEEYNAETANELSEDSDDETANKSMDDESKWQLVRPKSMEMGNIGGNGIPMDSSRSLTKGRSMSMPLLTDIEEMLKSMDAEDIMKLKEPFRVPIYLPACRPGITRMIIKKQFKNNRKRVPGKPRSMSICTLDNMLPWQQVADSNKSELEPVREETPSPAPPKIMERLGTPSTVRIPTPEPPLRALSPQPPPQQPQQPPPKKREIVKKERKKPVTPPPKPQTPVLARLPTPEVYEESPPSREISFHFVKEPSLPELPPVEIPDLPVFQEKESEYKGEKKEPNRKLIEVAPELPPQKKKLPPPPKVGPRITPKSHGRRSKVAEAPVTNQELQQLKDPLDFLAKYCIINPERLPYYERVFNGAVNVQTPRYSRDAGQGRSGGMVHLPPAQLSEHEIKMLRDMTVVAHAQTPRREGLSAPEQYMEKLNYSIEFIKGKADLITNHMHNVQEEKIRLMAAMAREMDRDIVRLDYKTKNKKKKKKKKKKKGEVPDFDKLGSMGASLANLKPTKASDITDEVIVSRMDDKMLKKAKKDPIIKRLALEVSRDIEKLKNYDQRMAEIEDEKDLVGLYCMDYYFSEQLNSTRPQDFRRQQSRLYQKLHPDPDVEMNIEEVEAALQQINNKLLTEREFQYIYFILDLPKREKINFRLFTIIAAMSEKVTQMDPVIRKLLNKVDYNALDVKMDKSKELFDLLHDEDYLPPGNAPVDNLAVELTAGGLTPEHTSYVMSKFNREGRGLIDFLDFVTYVPLFVEIHNRIIEDPFNETLNV